MRSALWLIIMATAVLAFVIPGGEPTTTIVGKVLSTEKVGDWGMDEIIRWELWRAEVRVERVTGIDTNIANRVSVYYTQDWSTHYVDITGIHSNRPSRLRLNTNAVYEFTCHNHANIRGEFGFGAETNGLRVLDGMVVPK